MGRIALFDIGYLLLFSNLVTESFSKGQRQQCGTKPDSPDFPELKIKVTVSATMLCFLCFHFSQKHLAGTGQSSLADIALSQQSR